MATSSELTAAVTTGSCHLLSQQMLGALYIPGDLEADTRKLMHIPHQFSPYYLAVTKYNHLFNSQFSRLKVQDRAATSVQLLVGANGYGTTWHPRVEKQ